MFKAGKGGNRQKEHTPGISIGSQTFVKAQG